MGQPGDVRIDAHLEHGKRQWCHLIEVNVPKLLKRVDVLFSARPEAPDGLQDRQCVSKQLDVRLKVRIHYVLGEFVAEIVAVGVDVVQPVGLVSVTPASDSQAKREITLPMRGWERWVRTSGSRAPVIIVSESSAEATRPVRFWLIYTGTSPQSSGTERGSPASARATNQRSH
jgi:hypothetical protein